MTVCAIALPGDSLPYNPSDEESVLAYAKALESKTLRQVIKDRLPGPTANELIASLSNNAGRGRFGQAVEEGHFQYKPNSKAAPDFGQMELKCTPLIRKDDVLVSKERIVICKINFGGDNQSKIPCILDETFENSHAWIKLRKLLLIFYEHLDVNALDLPIKLAAIWSPTEDERRMMKDDWERIRCMVAEGRAHEISEGMTLLLGACTKASDSTVRTKQAKSSEPAKPRAFALKQTFAQTIYESFTKTKPSPSMSDIKKYLGNKSTFETWLERKFSRFRNMSLDEICVDLGVEKRTDSLNQHAASVRAILNVLLTGGDNKSYRNLAELRKTGMQIKTVRINHKDKPHQAMSFPAFAYDELARETSWEDSSLYDLFTRRFLLIFLHDDGDGNCILARAVFWSMPEADLEKCETVWKQSVLAAKTKRYELMPGMKDSTVAHVRPHDQKGGPNMKRCYWLNTGYLADLWQRVKTSKG
jgi:DNA mismatch repair protein MutH